jgi:hypothetical protein
VNLFAETHLPWSVGKKDIAKIMLNLFHFLGRNAWLSYPAWLKAKSKTRSIASEVQRSYRYLHKLSNKIIGRCLHTSLHKFATRFKLLRGKDSCALARTNN